MLERSFLFPARLGRIWSRRVGISMPCSRRLIWKAELLALSDSNGYYLIRTGLNEEGWVWGRNVEVSLDEVFLLGISTYDLSEWRHWLDEDGDCQGARQEVLVRDADGPLTFRDRFERRECIVELGLWIDPFGGSSWTSPSDLDIDHMVPLRNAHFPGGWRWSRERKRAFANDLSDPEHLLAVRNGLNRLKADRSPEEWLPPATAAHCWYVRTWSRSRRGGSSAVRRRRGRDCERRPRESDRPRLALAVRSRRA